MARLKKNEDLWTWAWDFVMIPENLKLVLRGVTGYWLFLLTFVFPYVLYITIKDPDGILVFFSIALGFGWYKALIGFLKLFDKTSIYVEKFIIWKEGLKFWRKTK